VKEGYCYILVVDISKVKDLDSLTYQSDIFKSIYESGSEQKLKTFSQLLLLVTFKDLQKCHQHGETPIKEKEPIVGIAALKDVE
jgi:hypothetical protein